MTSDRRIFLYGSSDPLPKKTELTAGQLALVYESGFLRHISIGGKEVVRMVNHAVRDENWATVPLVITSEKVTTGSDGFSISYEAHCKNSGIDFNWSCGIIGSPDSSIEFTISGTARSSFRRNRIGFTVLHPVGPTMGKSCTLTDKDGNISVRHFPEHISPHQPFLNIRTMTWEPADNVVAVLEFAGDVFETEDQRNWLDASFKTYCTPLALPFPAQVVAGQQVQQRIRLRVTGTPSQQAPLSAGPVRLSADVSDSYPVVKIGTNLAEGASGPDEISKLAQLGMSFLRAELRHSDSGASEKATHILSVARNSGTPLHLVLFVPNTPDEAFIGLLRKTALPADEVTIYPAQGKVTTREHLDSWYPVVRDIYPRARLGAGTDAFFTELNRQRILSPDIDFLSFSANPQVHAFDNSTIVENLQTFPDQVQSAAYFSGGKKIHVGPVTLRMRSNPDATSKSTMLTNGLPPSADPRQVSLFCAGWTLCAINYLSGAGCDSVTLFESSGHRGLMPDESSRWPFPFPKSGVYPVYLLLRELLHRGPERLFRFTTSDPLKVDGLAFKCSFGYCLIAVNFSGDSVEIEVPRDLNLSGVKLFDGDVIASLVESPEATPPRVRGLLSILPPFSIAVFD